VALTGPSLCVTHKRSSGPSLTGGSVVRSAQAVIRPPPTPTQHPSAFPDHRLCDETFQQHRRLPGREGPPQFPPPPSERSTPSTPESSSRLRFQALHLFHGLHRERLGSALPNPRPKAGTLTARQASLNAADRSVAPPQRALDAGLRPDPFPGRAASLLPGLLAATRTGLTPAGDDELMSDHDHIIDLRHWAHSQDCCKYVSGAVRATA
jgi:hypothetical protein